MAAAISARARYVKGLFGCHIILTVAITQEQRKQLHDALVALPPVRNQQSLDSKSADIVKAMLEITDEEARELLRRLVASEVIKAELCPRGGEHYVGHARTKWISGAHI
jgi:hypothetical protein